MLGALLAITVFFAAPLVDVQHRRLRLDVDMSTNRLLPENQPGRTFYDYVRKAFGSDETMVVAVAAEDIFTHDVLSRIARMSDRLARVEGVHHVVAITNVANVRGTEDGIDVRPFVKDIPTDPQALEKLKHEALGNPIYAGNLISKDAKTAAIVVEFLDFSDRDFIDKGIDDEIDRIAREEAGPVEVYVTGGPHLKVAQVRYQLGDLRASIPLVVGALAIVLALSFRTLRGVILPLLAVTVALIWTLGFEAWLGKQLTITTVLVPPMLIILGVAYSVHVISEYYDMMRHDRRTSSQEAVHHVLKDVTLAALLTGGTTAAGFYSEVLTPITAIQEFGYMSVVGVLATLVVSLTLTPALLSALGRPRRMAHSEEAEEDSFFGQLMQRLAEFDLRNKRAIFWFWGAATLLSCLAATRLVVGNESLRFLPERSQQRRDFDVVNQKLDGANTFQVVVQADGETNFKQPENLRALESLQDWLNDLPEIGGTTGLVDFVKLLNRAFHENDPGYLAVPDTERLTGQLLFLGASDELEGYVDARYQLTNIQVRSTVFDTELVMALVNKIEQRLKQLPPGLHGQVTGNSILMTQVVDNLIWGQVQSIVGALIMIYALLCVMFLSFRLGVVALIPNVIPVAVYFGALGITGITLNFATSIIAPMALGVAIDDTIHYFARFNTEAKKLADEKRATISVLRSVGRPVLYSTISLCVGFLMLSWSDLLSYRQVGGMGAFTLGFSVLVEMTLTPALCGGLRIVTLWDTLTLDLGSDPQVAIPLFRDLSKAQCRIVALMASLRSVPSGEPLMRVGQTDREMYVIVDGALRVWKDGPAGPIDLRTSERGDVIGDVGLFTGERSANVDVAKDARLLRFTPNNLQRLRRRYPRIASTVQRNLNEILARRLSDLTDRLR
ncbi:MAG TPA: efflux RND transporter permease subunit [Myxococcota bacterium]|nr:efflux RND transporter permease subunit [Myxococcota bacterium]